MLQPISSRELLRYVGSSSLPHHVQRLSSTVHCGLPPKPTIIPTDRSHIKTNYKSHPEIIETRQGASKAIAITPKLYCTYSSRSNQNSAAWRNCSHSCLLRLDWTNLSERSEIEKNRSFRLATTATRTMAAMISTWATRLVKKGPNFPHEIELENVTPARRNENKCTRNPLPLFDDPWPFELPTNMIPTFPIQSLHLPN